MQADNDRRDRQPSPERLATILDSISDGVFTVDGEWRITSFNRAAEEITGIPREEALGQTCCEVFRASICESECALRHTLDTRERVVGKAVYIVDARGQRIPISISTAILRDSDGRVLGGVETFRDLSHVEELRKRLTGQYTFADIISQNHRMQELFSILPQVAASESTVLIEGESGTGKELVARALHNLSRRRNGPFVAINCGALPDTLLESELFGYKAGAFTGADRDKPGRFASARGGTLFLDEIGDVAPVLQVRLLRVLQERTFEPLGSNVPEQADVRVVAATYRDLEAAVAAGEFREDLYYRVNVIRLQLPPLRERKEDIPLLVDHFITRFNRLRGKEITGVAPETMTLLARHDYPGNVRELENAIEHAFVLCSGGQLEPAHLPRSLVAGMPDGAPAVAGRTLEEMERWVILEALRRNHGNRLATARELGIHKSTLFRKISALGLQLPAQDGRSRPR
jgi:PAS domain S-box-containing protein